MGAYFGSFFTTIITFFVLCTSVAYVYFKYSFNYWSKRRVPYLQPTFPFGNVKTIFSQEESFPVAITTIYRKLKEKTQLAGGYYFFAKPTLMVISPELIKVVFAKEFNSFHDREFWSDEEIDPLSTHLAALDGLKWKYMRAKLTPTFTSGKMKMMFFTIRDSCTDLEHVVQTHIDQGTALDTKDIFARLTTDTIVSCAFGLECNSLRDPTNEFRRHGKLSAEFGVRETLLAILASTFPWVLQTLRMPLTKPEVSTFFIDALKKTVDYREKNNIHRKDFLDLLIRLKNNQSVLDDNTEVGETIGAGLTFNELAAQAFVFFAAGFDTTSTTLNFCTLELAANPDIQSKLRKEICETLAKYNEEIYYDAIMEMKYLDKVINETLRKYPPLAAVMRKCTKDYYISDMNYTVEKGTAVFISILGVHWDPEYYPDPEQFNPERFNEEVKSKRPSYTFLPFGEGPRICIGLRFALLQMKIALSVLLKRFQFTLDPKTEMPVRFDPKSPFLTPKSTIWIQAHRIEE